MTDEEAIQLIRKSINSVIQGAGDSISFETDLVKDGIIDSLDSMSFLFELEALLGKTIDEIDEKFLDFRVSTLSDIIKRV